MAITGRTPDECFDAFRSHVASLVKKVVPGAYPVRCDSKGQRRTLSFLNSRADDAIPIETADGGEVYLYMMQALTTVPVENEKRKHRLKTVAYAYKLYGVRPDLTNIEALVRWEYTSVRRPNLKWCPNHVQFGPLNGGSIRLPFGERAIDLKKMHLPTGWVLIEHVFRFLIHELGMKPPSADWHDVLHESEDRFRQFTG